MKKVFLIAMFFAFSAQAQMDFLQVETSSDEDIKQNSPTEVVNEYITDLEDAARVQQDARKILLQKNDIISLRNNQKKMIEDGNKKREQIKNKFILDNNEVVPEIAKQQEDEQKETIKKSLTKAPFDLYWNATVQDLNTLGFVLEKTQREGYENVYKISNYNKENSVFALIIAAFGTRDRLWNIYARGKYIDDEANASKVLELYNKYYKALDKKYGNAEQFYQANVIEEQITDEKTAKTTSKITKQEIGNSNFLQELKEEKASLYATFNNEKIGVILGIGVNDKGQSYITLDYKNLQLMKKEQDNDMQKIMEEL